MSISTYPPIDYEALRHMNSQGTGPRVVINPRTGNPQIQEISNDVTIIIGILGGVTKAAAWLGVEEIEIEHWIDDHYVPPRYAEKIHKRLPGWSIWSMQVPGFMDGFGLQQMLNCPHR